jgi:hypothetical protein
MLVAHYKKPNAVFVVVNGQTLIFEGPESKELVQQGIVNRRNHAKRLRLALANRKGYYDNGVMVTSEGCLTLWGGGLGLFESLELGKPVAMPSGWLERAEEAITKMEKETDAIETSFLS